MKRNSRVKKIALIGVFGGLAGILTAVSPFHFPLPFLPPFMEFDLANVPELIGGFAYGPIAALCIIFVKILTKLALVGTGTMFTGEISNILLSVAFVIPAVFLYHKKKDKQSAIKGMQIGTLCATSMAIVTNVCFIFPFYAHLFQYTMEDLVAMCTAVNPLVTNMVWVVVLGIIPFNLIKFGINSFVTKIMYKKISPILKRFN